MIETALPASVSPVALFITELVLRADIERTDHNGGRLALPGRCAHDHDRPRSLTAAHVERIDIDDGEEDLQVIRHRRSSPA